ncbi:30S ribosomal protein THX [Frigoriflavimonas asaccharolytica]|uniref:30S ribosomal protein S31 n=1 Tax=Frigoriflavimonas asaccharolytica TaxID=2735899 RepID=A0A8J8K9Q4_9FLAO|nr:30S ribosomal protein THX [Frigoriflavimonas asaccharolytica]NRS93916.1 30S ribosomal protein S31 [Frigoriflavimonas asaccharolytica]
MGKGDKRSRRGKVTNGSYGKKRLRKGSTPLFAKAEAAVVEKKEEKKPA